ncbi:hypothetical protein OH77DRAFT_1428796 [Trametes cingulata]|nr:hypothetical protein OH77DRAFT_1428796 [Trametes cingulata]
MQQVFRTAPQSIAAFKDAPVIVGTKEVFYAKDKMNRVPVTGEVHRGLWNLPSSVTNDSLSRLPLVNGTEGTIRRVVHEEIDGVLYATVAYVHVPMPSWILKARSRCRVRM